MRRHSLRGTLIAISVVCLFAVASVAGASLVVGWTFTSVNSRGTMIDISDAGNVLSLQSPNSAPQQYDHIDGVPAVPPVEGYVLCYTNPISGAAVQTFDLGGPQAGWGPAVLSNLTPTTARVQRDTLDGIFRLTMDFTFQGETRGLHIRHTLENISPVPVPAGVVFRRHVDLNIDSGGPSGWAAPAVNNFMRTRDSVTAWNDPAAAPAGRQANGVVLSHLSAPNQTPLTKITDPGPVNACNPPALGNLLLGFNAGATLQYNIAGPVNPGAAGARVITMRYYRI